MYENLPFLIRLCDDPSQRVRDKIFGQLRAIPDLAGELARRELELNDSQRQVLAPLLTPRAPAVDIAFVDEAVRLVNAIEGNFELPATLRPAAYGSGEERPHWLEWLDYEDEWAQLEAALDSVARWLDFDFGGANAADAAQLIALWPEAAPASISQVLDDLARDFRMAHDRFDASDLADWLFTRRAEGVEAIDPPHDDRTTGAARLGPALRGAPSGDFYNPQNSHLVHVVRRGRGLPIALAAIFMLVGRRVGLEIHGCNFPGHFLAFVNANDGAVFFDPFDGGRELTVLETAAICRAAPEATGRPALARDIVARFLRNLATAYEYSSHRDKARFMLQLLAELEATGSRG